EKTVKNHLRSIFSKLKVSDRTKAAIKAIQEGLIETNQTRSQEK
ncbi:response regulator transcription factor, partial [Nitrospira defluvii]|nr:response regulator transcription factor [Nitrospira defluvii]